VEDHFMFARITTLRFVTEVSNRGFNVLQESIVPTIKQQHGFAGLLLLRGPGSDCATTVTLWESAAAFEASATGNYPLQIAKLEGLLAGPPTRQIFDVEEISGLAVDAGPSIQPPVCER
jgi:heme-degrading monooxygenase HmoA